MTHPSPLEQLHSATSHRVDAVQAEIRVALAVIVNQIRATCPHCTTLTLNYDGHTVGVTSTSCTLEKRCRLSAGTLRYASDVAGVIAHDELMTCGSAGLSSGGRDEDLQPYWHLAIADFLEAHSVDLSDHT